MTHSESSVGKNARLSARGVKATEVGRVEKGQGEAVAVIEP